MTYILPGVRVTQVFLQTQPALAAQALPNVSVGAAYQLVTDDFVGTYSGLLQQYSYASLIAGAQVDLETLSPSERFVSTKKPITLQIKEAVVEIVADGLATMNAGNPALISRAGAFANVKIGDLLRVKPTLAAAIVPAQVNGTSTILQPNRLTTPTAGLFANVKSGDEVVVTAGDNTNLATYTVTAKINDETLSLNAAVNDGNGAGANIEFTVTGDRGVQNEGEYVVKARIDNDSVELQSPLGQVESPINVQVVREVDEIVLDRVSLISDPGFVASEDGVELPPGLQFVDMGDGPYPILSGNVFISYRALRNDLAFGLNQFSDIAEVYALFGGITQVTPQNPLGFASAIALQNAATPTNILGLDGNAASNEVLSFQNAFDILKSTEMYAITTLTQNLLIAQLAKTHVEQMSQPDRKKERVALVNSLLVTEQNMKSQATTSDEVTGSRTIVNTRISGESLVADADILNDQTLDAFLMVEVGDTLTLVAGDDTVPGEYTVIEKITNNSLRLDTTIVTADAADITYFLSRKDGISASATRIYDRSAMFLAAGIAPGMFVRIFDASSAFAVGTHRITNVISNKEIEVEQIPGIVSLITEVDYEVFRNLTKVEQAGIIKGVSESLGSRRLVHVWPDAVNAPVGNTLVPVPGFYQSVALGALITGLPSQQGFTNLTLSGFLGAINSNDYFGDDELNIIADGGTTILVQLGVGQALLIRHQLTTDRSAVVFQELSLTKNIDFAAKFIRTNYQSFIGVYNIVDTTIDELKSRATTLIKFLQEETRQPRIGGVIRSGVLRKLEESETRPDAVNAIFRCNFPFPLNNIDIDLEIE
jgi:hypothetical protein